MKRTALLCIVALTCVAAASAASAQSFGLVPDTTPDGQPSPPLSSGANGARPTPCMPPGMPASDQLVNVGAVVLLVPVEGRDSALKVDAVGFITKDHLIEFREGERSLDFIAYYVEGALAAVDDDPDDATQPALVDTGMVSAGGAVLAHGTPSCQWVRVTRRPDDRPATSSGTRI